MVDVLPMHCVWGSCKVIAWLPTGALIAFRISAIAYSDSLDRTIKCTCSGMNTSAHKSKFGSTRAAAIASANHLLVLSAFKNLKPR